MNKIYFITGNKGKFLEAKKKLVHLEIEVVQKNLGYPEIQAEKLEDVALFGVEHVQKSFKKPFILEDAGLFIDALNGFPGVYSAYVFQTVGCEGILELMKNIKAGDRKATFKSVYAYGEPSKKPLFFIGESCGRISEEIKGSHGFGYDPIFIPDGETKTFAEMGIDEKNIFSHRGKALEKLIDFFNKL